MSMEPVTVYDTREPDYHAWPYWRDAEAWLRDQGVIDFMPGEPRGGTYRVEVWLIDLPFARCFRYARNKSGHGYRVGGEPALEKPEDLPLRELPPPHLWRE